MKNFTGFKPSSNIVKPEEKFSNFLQSPSANAVVGAQSLIDWRNFCSPVENQYDVGSCSSQSTISNLEFLKIRDGKQHIDLSRMFLYYNARLITNSTNLDDGSEIRANFEALKLYGVCSEKTYPYDVSRTFMRPYLAAYREAFANRIHQYYRLEGSGERRHEEILKCLKSCHPVVFGMQVYESFRHIKSVMLEPKHDEKLLGGHAMLIVGVDLSQKVYIVRNSWGVNFAQNGYFYLPFYLLEKYATYEFWTATSTGK